MASATATSYRLEEAAALLSCSVRTLGRWHARGKIRVVRLPGVAGVRVSAADVERIRREQAAQAAEAEKVLSEPATVTTT